MFPDSEEKRPEPVEEMEQTVEELKRTIETFVNERSGQDVASAAVAKETGNRKQAVSFIRENARDAVTASAYARMHLQDRHMTMQTARGTISSLKEKAMYTARKTIGSLEHSLSEEQKNTVIALRKTVSDKLHVMHKKGCLLLDDILTSERFQEFVTDAQKGIENGLYRLQSLSDKKKEKE